MTATILLFPTRPAPVAPQPAWPTPLRFPKTRTVTLLALDGSLLAEAGFLPGACSDVWAWITETVAREFECTEEEVSVLEADVNSPDWAGDLITADGIPVCQCAL